MIQIFSHISNTYQFIIVLWMLSAAVFVLALIRRNRITAFIKTNNTIQYTTAFLKVNKIIYRLFLGLAVYILIFRIGLGWQFRVGMITMYVIYFLYFAFMDFTIQSFNLKTEHPPIKIRIFKSIRWFYVRLRGVYFIITGLGFFFSPSSFLFFSLLTPDSGISGHYDVDNNGKEYYERVIDYEDIYGIRSPFYIALEYESYRPTSFWNFKGELEFDEALHIYDVYCLFFKKRVQTKHYDGSLPSNITYFSKDSFLVNGHRVMLDDEREIEKYNRELIVRGLLYYREGKQKLFAFKYVVLDTNLTIIGEY